MSVRFSSEINLTNRGHFLHMMGKLGFQSCYFLFEKKTDLILMIQNSLFYWRILCESNILEWSYHSNNGHTNISGNEGN